MIIKISKPEKVELLRALKDGYLDTTKIPALQAVLDSERPDLKFAALSDEELDQKIKELERKLHGSNL